MENQFFVDSDKLSPQALEKKHRLENDKNSRTDHMAYMDGMEQISPDIRNKVISAMNEYDYGKYTATDVLRALEKDTCSVEDFKALLSPAAEPFLEKMAEKAQQKPFYLDENGEKVEYDNTYYLNDVEIVIEPMTKEKTDKVLQFIESVDQIMNYNSSITSIIEEETEPYFAGQKSAKEVADIIQSRVQIYVNENR